MPVTFDGANRLIICTSGTTALNVQNDIYSPWKEWVRETDNSKYTPALRVVGGDPISGSFALGATFFLTNDWKIRPQESTHTLDVAGNIFVDPSGSQFVPTLGNYNVLIRMTVSNLIDLITVNTGGESISFTEDDRNALRAIYSGTAPGAGVSGTFSVSDRNNILSIFSGTHLGSDFTLNLQDRTTINSIFSGTHAGVLTGSFTPLDRLILSSIFSGSHPGALTGSFTVSDRTIVYAIFSGTHLGSATFTNQDRTTLNSVYSGTSPGTSLFNLSDRNTINNIFSGTHEGALVGAFTQANSNMLTSIFSGTHLGSSTIDFSQNDRIALNSIYSGTHSGAITDLFTNNDRTTLNATYSGTLAFSSSVDFLSTDRNTLNSIYSGTSPSFVSSTFNVSPASMLEIADNVWNEPINQHLTSGSMGFIVHKLERMSGSIEFNRAMQGGRWRIFNHQMIFYGEDNNTVIATFNLYDINGNPCETAQSGQPIDRIRVG